MSSEQETDDTDRSQQGFGLGVTTDLNFFENSDEVLKPTDKPGPIKGKVVKKQGKHQLPPAARNSWDDPYLS